VQASEQASTALHEKNAIAALRSFSQPLCDNDNDVTCWQQQRSEAPQLAMFALQAGRTGKSLSQKKIEKTG
jgi:hypothetical protein